MEKKNVGNQQELKPLECVLSQPGEACVHRCRNNPPLFVCVRAQRLCVRAQRLCERARTCVRAVQSYMAAEKACLQAEAEWQR